MSVVTGANGGEVGVWAEAEPAITADAAKNSVTNLFILFSFRGGDIRRTTLRYWCYVPRFYHVDHMRSFQIAKLAINFSVILPHASGAHDGG